MKRPVTERRFHAGDGWYFLREKDGGVTITKARYGTVRLSADAWATAVATVSEIGMSDSRFDEARNFHTELKEDGDWDTSPQDLEEHKPVVLEDGRWPFGSSLGI